MERKVSEITRKRANKAYEMVNQARSLNEKFKEYISHVEKLPMLIKTNGLAAAIAFAKAKGEAWGKIYSQIEEWLKERELVERDLMEEILTMTTPKYIHTTQEVLSLLEWMKRFAEGMKEGK